MKRFPVGNGSSTVPRSVRLAAVVLGCCLAGCGTDANSDSGNKAEMLVQSGKKYYATYGCATCHTVNGAASQAPTFKGLYGSQETLEDGSTVTVDAAYVSESIREPAAKIVKGYKAMHPPYKNMLDEEKIQALVAYIKSLK